MLQHFLQLGEVGSPLAFSVLSLAFQAKLTSYFNSLIQISLNTEKSKSLSVYSQCRVTCQLLCLGHNNQYLFNKRINSHGTIFNALLLSSWFPTISQDTPGNHDKLTRESWGIIKLLGTHSSADYSFNIKP